MLSHQKFTFVVVSSTEENHVTSYKCGPLTKAYHIVQRMVRYKSILHIMVRDKEDNMHFLYCNVRGEGEFSAKIGKLLKLCFFLSM